MKRINMKVFVGCVLIVFFTLNAMGQTKKSDDKKTVKVEKTKVPKPVTDKFYMEYPGNYYENWYGYPAYDYGDYWYDDWYGNGPYIYNDYPEYYEVEFTKDNAVHNTVYSKTGKKVATHKKFTTDLPKAVSTAIGNSMYKTWILDTDKEEIFKDTDKDQMKVYKVSVHKGSEKHTLFFQNDGKLLRDKKVV